MSCFSPNGLKDEQIDYILEAARSILETGKDALELSPVPGLNVAAGALSFLIGMIQKTRGNTKAREELSRQIESLSGTIMVVHEKSVVTVNNFQPTHRDELKIELKTSLELKERVEKLVQSLQKIGEEASELSKRTFFLRCMRSSRDEETLNDFKDRIRYAKDTFVFESQVTVEKLVNNLSAQIAQLVVIVERIDETVRDKKDEDTLLALPVVEASYRADHNSAKSHYLSGTRAALLEELGKWARVDESFADFPIYILSGTAGTGKSTIAYEIAKRLEQEKLLGASFFFIRGAERLSTTRFVIPSLAFQLARNRPELYSHIVEAARVYLGFGQRQQIEFQLEDLLIKPLKHLPEDHPPLVIIIDAVDECTESAQDEVAHLLFLLMKNIRRVSFPLRILLTTRPEIHIETALNSYEFRDITKPFKLQDIPVDVANTDISQYLEDGFVHFRFKEQLVAKRPNAVSELTKRAEGLFIYAATARSFIFRNVEHPDDAVRRIDRLLSETEDGVPSVTKRLDMLYLTVLDHAFPQEVLERPDFVSKLQDLLGSVALLQDQVSPKTLESLIGTPVDETTRILSRLASVIQVSSNLEVEIRPIHASFPQFLIDSKRCTSPLFFVDPSVHHSRFASISLTILCHPRMSYEKLRLSVPLHVQYACLHWATHLCLSQPTPQLLTLLHELLTTRLFLWFEALSLFKRLGSAAPALFRVRSWLQAHSAVTVNPDTYDQVMALLNNGYRFILEYFTPIEVSPGHIYTSALPLMPTCMLQELYAPRYQNLPSLLSMTERENKWGPCLRAMEGHTGRVSSVRYSPDGRYIVSGAWDNTVRTWLADSGTPLNIMRGHEESVEAVDFCPDTSNRQIVSGSSDATLRIWDFASGATLHRLPAKRGNVFAVAYSPDGKKIVSGSYNNALHIWDAATGKRLMRKDGHYNCINSVAFSRDGDYAVTAASDNKVRIWNAHTGEMIHVFVGHTDQAKDAAFFPDSKRVASGASDQTVRIWDIETRKCLKVLKGHSGRVFSIAISPRGDIVASGAGDSDPSIRLWDSESGRVVSILKDHNSWVLSLCFSPDGRTLASASDDNMVRIWDVTDRSAGSRRIVGHAFAINCLVFSTDGVLIATGSDDNTVAIWETSTGKRLHHLKKHSNRVSTVAFSPDHKRLVSAGWDNDIHVWDATTGELWRKLNKHSKGVEAVAYSPNGEWIASGGNNLEPIICIWRAIDGSLEKTIEVDFRGEPIDMIRSLEFSPDSTMLHTETINGLLYIWDIASKDVLDEFENRWELEESKARFKEEDGWIISKASGKKLCWIAGSRRGREGTFASHGDYYATGAGSGQLTILNMSELLE